MSHPIPAFPKPVRLRSDAYIRWIRQQPCLVHPRSVPHAHHTTSRGAGGSDYRTVPLCFGCHNEIHQLGQARFEERHAVSFNEEMLRLLETYLAAQNRGRP